ncbi:hypothetical protein HYDPIDRAFT_158855 [Hydnomerulius pinastri MD-312]|uniref:Condensation domain-containing protein n=1 Tax=Hydnomerulius pinastri MD-312 TaxID=994086 RepID=A0A0C9W5D0_9AGAM|nr:hypothetical protein HYDPIDRAFT_158855 [Hydnomerulius pinastri MD-312]
MSSWTQLDSSPGNRVFYRPLGITETGFYWDSIHNSTADSVMHIHLSKLQQDDVAALPNVVRAWRSVKRRFPLLVAEVQAHESGPRFCVHEGRLEKLLPEEVTSRDVGSFAEADAFVSSILEGPRPLSSELLARVYILRRTDRNDHFHVVMIVAHCITDGSSTSTVMRTFFDALSSPIEHPVDSLEERLAMYLSLESQIPYKHLSVAQRRWRSAIGFAIYTVRSRVFKGGHTLPGKFTTTTSVTPALPRILVQTMPQELSQLVLHNCKRLGITFNNAYFTVSQVAMARVLCRRYLRGEIGEEEWNYRKRQPMHFYGPLNLRPYLDNEWLKKGGAGEVGLNISFFHFVLPFMPLGTCDLTSDLVNGAPSFASLMSFKRFLHRSALVKSQSEKLFRHPRFVDISVAAHVDRIEPSRVAALDWVQQGEERRHRENARLEWVGTNDPILAQGGSSLGNMDTLFPLEYPLPPSHPLSPSCPEQDPGKAGYKSHATVPEGAVIPSTLRVEYWRTHLHARPAELYLGASKCQHKLQYNVFYDGNVFDDNVVQEWLDEVLEATSWYLGCSHEVEHPRCKL